MGIAPNKDSAINQDHTVCIVGIGYVGLTLGVAMADAGFRIHGVERLGSVREAVAEGRAHFREIGLNEHLERHVKSGRFTISETIPNDPSISVYIITVGTPLLKSGDTDLESISAVAGSIASVLKPNDFVILRSTVELGTTRNVILPRLQSANCDFDLAFCPERTLEGKALQELRSLPQVVGGLTQRSAMRATQMFNHLTPTIVRVSSLEAAEMVKLINNTQRDLYFAFANEVAEMCEAAGVTAMEVIRSSNMGYPRSSIPLPGLVGGPCLEKDPWILAKGLRKWNYEPTLSLAGRRLNRDMPSGVIRKIERYAKRFAMPSQSDLKVAILGLAFKGEPETDDLRGTMALPIVNALKASFPGCQIVGHDPIVTAPGFAEIDVSRASDLDEAFRDASIVIIQNNHRMYQGLNLSAHAMFMRKPGLIFDFWNLFTLRDISLPEKVEYFGFGSFPALPDGSAMASVWRNR